ncbi:hypothetical protein RJT34_04063 [Clitoria ternatea]|uniref:Uncharacterized protein n=1 Tax=Clitoria ternatea TaxID=43366 RepID=A0AAN9KP28_CLITE
MDLDKVIAHRLIRGASFDRDFIHTTVVKRDNPCTRCRASLSQKLCCTEDNEGLRFEPLHAFLVVEHSQASKPSSNVSGNIPGFLTRIKTLDTLYLSYNNLSGNLPPSISSLPNLVRITFDGNRISGPILDSYGSFSNLTTMTLSHNRLSWKIPATMAKLNLAVLDLSRNMLEGDASVFFGAEKETLKINLAKNSLAFDLGKLGCRRTWKGWI